MRRRDFITLIAGATADWPLGAHAQPAGKLPTIGFLGPGTASAWSQWVAAFAQRLRELGCNFGKAFRASFRPAILDRDGAAVDPAELAQPLHKGGGPLAPARSGG